MVEDVDCRVVVRHRKWPPRVWDETAEVIVEAGGRGRQLLRCLGAASRRGGGCRSSDWHPAGFIVGRSGMSFI